MQTRQARIQLLGQLAVSIGGTSIALPKSRKTRAVLAYLADEKKPVNRSTLSSLFFPDTDDPRGNLRWCVSRLRAACGQHGQELICSDSSSIWLDTSRAIVDVHRIASAEQETADADNEETLRVCAEMSLAGFLGDLEIKQLADYEAWRVIRQAHYHSLRGSLLDKTINQILGRAEAIEYAYSLVRLAPESERSWYLLINALAEAGQPVQARKFFEFARTELRLLEVPEVGLLALASHEMRSNSAPGEKKVSAASKPGTVRPTLAVLPCGFTSGVKPARELTDELSHAIFASAALTKSFTLISPDARTSPESPASGEMTAVSPIEADLSLESKLSVYDNAHRQLAIKLIDQSSGACLHSWQCSFAAVSTHRLIEEVSSYFCGRFEIDLPMAMIGLAQEKLQSELTALDRYYLALPHIFGLGGYSPVDALTLLQRSLDSDPNLAYSQCAMAWVRSTHPEYNSTVAERAIAAQMARRAVDLLRDDPLVLGWAAMSIASLEKDLDTSLSIARRGLSLNSQSTFCLLASGLIEHFAGNDELSLDFFNKVEAIDDIDSLSFLTYPSRARCYYQLGRLEEAIGTARKAVGMSTNVFALRVLTASLSRAGHLAEARSYAQKMIALDQSEYLQFFREFMPYKNAETIDQLCEDLGNAGIPEVPATVD